MSTELGETYNTRTSGLFIANKVEFCEIAVEVIENKGEVIHKIWEHRSERKYLLTGIAGNRRTIFFIASPEICDSNGREHVLNDVVKTFGKAQFGKVTPFRLQDAEEVQRRLGLLDVNLSNFVDGPFAQCRIVRKKRLSIDFRSVS